MDKKAKLIAKIPLKDRERILVVIEQILKNDIAKLDIKKLHGITATFRVRVGDFRIQYHPTPTGNVVEAVTRRGEHTCRFIGR